jgi:hypothetical protein
MFDSNWILFAVHSHKRNANWFILLRAGFAFAGVHHYLPLVVFQ